MSGHSKWSTIKHKKGAADAKRGRLFTKLVREIIVSAREGGGDIDSNPRLRSAIKTAQGANMPSANVERAIKRGTGEIEGIKYEEYTYEGYGPGGVAVLVDVMTDNRNRTVSEVRHVFSKYDGNMAESGAVAWNFDQKGLLLVSVGDLDEDEFMMTALDAGAEDVIHEEDFFHVYTSSSDLHTVARALDSFEVEKAELTRVPKNSVKADEVAGKLFRLLEKLEDLDDVQKVYANFEVSDEVMERLAAD
ncbi:MAG: YebC/PmpR family DNA-binding transcriptional regulator [Candidatus Cloacimonetes bacterium]|nr:YebC/PmpR family DNA-binding transcriptional regulator [Candidatus Cloacimonadota bacterium]